MSTQHNVKCWTPFFDLSEQGRLPVQIRKNDRNYQSGDVLNLQEFEPIQPDTTTQIEHPDGRYTGRERKHVINHVVHHLPGVRTGYVVLTLRPFIER